MKNNIQNAVDNSLAVWEKWNALGYSARIDILSRLAKKLDKEAQQMIEFQCNNALQEVSETLLMPGPTGETNELYCAGRGVFVVSADADLPASVIVGQISAALVTGNTVVLCFPDNNALKSSELSAQLLAAGCPKDVVEYVNYEDFKEILKNEKTAGLAYAGQLKTSQRLARLLAEREGLLAQLIVECDCITLPVIACPAYILRFVTEKTRSINITAIGGNAKLLELGGGDV
ncbi:aldehyde dehydrogenase family protein [Psychromonas sp.]|uniref:aldehyde dehydrogenase family protein n=1 Tax=Psychromonas sp. TaxID=1884585 RepID=UPI0035677453